MKKEEFLNWLSECKEYTNNTIRSRASNCATIELYYGNLDELYDQDHCDGLIKAFAYSCDDKMNKREANHKIPIDGDIYNGTVTYRSALNLYINFRDNFDSGNYRNVKVIPEAATSGAPQNLFANELSIYLSQFPFCLDSHKEPDTFISDVKEYIESNPAYSQYTWEREFKPSIYHGDSLDLFGKSNHKSDYSIVIEFDAHRADQVAKKFVSRVALLSDRNIIYIAMCYPVKSEVSKKECEKYFNYCNIVSSLISMEKNETIFAGILF